MSRPEAEFLHTLFDNIHDGIYQIDQDGRVVTWNNGAERITGIPANSVLGSDCRDNMVRHLSENGLELPQKHVPILATLADGVRREIMTYIRHTEGFRIATLARTFPVLDDANRITGALEVFTDAKSVIASFQRNQRVDQTVFFDALTGIGNRSHIEGKIKAALEDLLTDNREFGILFIDIDHFKDFNDKYGHLTGDKVLRFVANTLRHNLRLSDSCGRWGGEEFIALVLEINGNALKLVAEKLRLLVESGGVTEDERELKVTISLGATMARKEDTLQSLLKRADKLMYRSKQAGRNRVTTSD